MSNKRNRDIDARRVLIVAYYFPPIGGIGSIRLARFATYLPEFGWEPTVIAPRGTPHASDPSLHFPEEKVVRSQSIELSHIGRALPGGRGEAQSARRTARQAARNALRTEAHRYVFYPDGQVGWYPGATIAGLRALRGQRFDVVYSSSNPITAHLVARTLSRRARLPWVAEFRDPWSDRLGPDHPHSGRATVLAAAIGRCATEVLVPTPTWAAYYSELWGRDVSLVPNGHDIEAPSHERPGCPTLTHVGTYYQGRQDFRALWAAMALLQTRAANKVPRIRFVGELPGQVREELAAFGLVHLVHGTGFLPHDEAMRAMMSSSILIASGFAGSDPVSRGVIPAKLFEYLASGLPILYFGDPADDAARLLSGQPGCHVVAPTDVSGGLAALQSALAGGNYDRDVKQLSRRARTQTLAEILDQAVRGGYRDQGSSRGRARTERIKELRFPVTSSGSPTSIRRRQSP